MAPQPPYLVLIQLDQEQHRMQITDWLCGDLKNACCVTTVSVSCVTVSILYQMPFLN